MYVVIQIPRNNSQIAFQQQQQELKKENCKEDSE